VARRPAQTTLTGGCYARDVALLAKQPYDFDDYLELEASSAIKHEFLDGNAWAMAGGSPEHAALAGNVVRLLGQALLGRRCRAFTSDLRIRVTETGLATYPDVSVICSQLELDPEDRKGHTVVNPTLLVEVLSPSTEAYDRGEKLAHYKRIPALREVMLVAHDEHRIDLWRRTTGGWTQLTFGPGQAVELESLHGIELPVDGVYFDPLAL
jgi:Uma2 family endonuclease